MSWFRKNGWKAAVLAAAASAGALAEISGTQGALSGCAPPTTKDSLCRNKRIVRVQTPTATTPSTVLTDSTRILAKQTRVSLLSGGIAALYMKTQAGCTAEDIGRGATITTRTSRVVILTLDKGYMICTLGGLVVEASRYATLRTTGFTVPALAFAGGQPSSFRVVLDPRLKRLRIAVFKTGVTVRFRNGRTVGIEPRKELVVKLIGRFRVGRPLIRPAKFTPPELDTFAVQAQLIR